jgi:hypothetical protein
MTVRNDRRWVYSLVALYAALALGRVAFAGSVVSPLIAAENPGSTVSAVKH